MKYKHGETNTRLFNVWIGMKQRCNNPNGEEYHRYGGRGIKVCDEWLSYSNFRDWAMLNGYDENAPRGRCTIDRIDNDGDYEPSNCRWVDMREQMKNRPRIAAPITYNNESHTLYEWSKIMGLPFQTIRSRWRNGWSIEKVLTTPIGRRSHPHHKI